MSVLLHTDVMRSTTRILVAVLCENAQFLFLCRLICIQDSTATISTEIQRVSYDCCFTSYVFVKITISKCKNVKLIFMYEPKERLVLSYSYIVH